MRHWVIAFCVFAASCAMGNDAFSHTPGSNGSGPLTRSECTRLVRREFFNFPFSKDSPFDSRMITSCTLGRGSYKRSFYDCVFATKYSDTLRCAYAARGIDTAKRNPILAAQKVGERGFTEGATRDFEAAIYKGLDPRLNLGPFTAARFLDERDNVDRSLGIAPPADRDTPLRKSASCVSKKGRTYWIVREDFIELQLVKIRREDAAGADTVVCAQLGNSRRLRTDQGYCAAMIRDKFHIVLAD